MHAMFVAMMLAVGQTPDADTFTHKPSLTSGQPVPVIGSAQGPLDQVPGPYHYEPPRDPQEADGLVRGFFNYCRAWFQPMPQTCYSPHFGCYPGNGRDIYRYPAFHGNYYRQAYNYRPLYEYPWQAGMVEPLPLELSSEKSMVGNPEPPSQQPEVIKTPATNPPYSLP